MCALHLICCFVDVHEYVDYDDYDELVGIFMFIILSLYYYLIM